jgi:hypothetical protein
MLRDKEAVPNLACKKDAMLSSLPFLSLWFAVYNCSSSSQPQKNPDDRGSNEEVPPFHPKTRRIFDTAALLAAIGSLALKNKFKNAWTKAIKCNERIFLYKL